MKSWSIGCWPVRISANAGRGTGSIWRGSPRATASSTIPIGRRRITIAISSFGRSTTICPTTTFVRWQLAGDEFEPENPLAMMATGFLAAGVHSTQITKNEVEKHRYDEMDDMLATTGTAMLGLTFGCARCHDHKYDPIPQRDYYRMLSAFTTTVRSEADLDADPAATKLAKEKFDKEHEPFVAALRKYEHDELPARLAEWERTEHREAERRTVARARAAEHRLTRRSHVQASRRRLTAGDGQ